MSWVDAHTCSNLGVTSGFVCFLGPTDDGEEEMEEDTVANGS